MLSRSIDNRILEMQNSKDPTQIMELLKRKNAINIIRRKINEKLGRTGIHRSLPRRKDYKLKI